MIVDKRTREQIFSPENYRQAYDNFEFDMSETLGAVAGDAAMHNPTPALWRLAKDKLFSDRSFPLTADEANEKYGMDGALKFDGLVVTDGFARGMMELKQKEQRNQEIMNKGQKGVIAGAAKVGTGLAVSVVDPINVASAFIPGAPLLRGMGMAKLAAAKGMGASVAKGVVGGAIGAAAIEPLPYFSAKKYQLDYDMTDSLLNVAFGGVLGGGFAGVGAFFRGRSEAKALDRILTEKTHAEQIELLSRGLNSAISDKYPNINADLVADAKNKLRASAMTDEDFLKYVPELWEPTLIKAKEIKDALSGIPADIKKSIGYTPESLTQFIKRNGGIQDAGGELSSRDVNLPGLLRKNKARIGTINGVKTINNQIDSVRERVFNAGYFPDKKDYKDITESELFDAISRDLSGNRVYKKDDLDAVMEATSSINLGKQYNAAGFDESMSVGQIFDELMAQEFEAKASEGIESDVYNQVFDENAINDPAYLRSVDSDMFLVSDDSMDLSEQVLLSDTQKQLDEMSDEIRSALDGLSEKDRALYEETFSEIDDEITLAEAFKADASNLATCLLSGGL